MFEDCSNWTYCFSQKKSVHKDVLNPDIDSEALHLVTQHCICSYCMSVIFIIRYCDEHFSRVLEIYAWLLFFDSFILGDSEVLLRRRLRVCLRFTVKREHEVWCVTDDALLMMPAPYNATGSFDRFHGTILLSSVFHLCFY